MKFILSTLAIFLITLPLKIRAQDELVTANENIIQACKKAGGTMTDFTAGKCYFKKCVYKEKKTEIYLSGTNTNTNCSDEELKQAVSQINAEIGISVNSGSGSGVNSGSGGGGNSSGSGGGGTGEGTIICEELEGEGRIGPGMPCYRECKKRGLERKKCVECLLKHPGLYNVKREHLPRDRQGRVIGDTGVDLGGAVRVRTGTIICKDANGRIISVNGSICPNGSTVYHPTTPGTGGGTGSVVVTTPGGSGSGAGGANIQFPSYCNTGRRRDMRRCREWIDLNARFLCSSGQNTSICTGGADIDIRSRYDRENCVNCAPGGRRQSTLSGIAEIFGALAPVGSAYITGRAYQNAQEAWAGAAAAGYEQCQLGQANYLDYLSANELPALTPAQQQAMNCNGFGLGGYAGLQNPALGGWYAGGYSPGFVGGMMGPYGNYNPYMSGGFPNYQAGTIGVGGVISGYPGGYINGGIQGVVHGGYINGGYIHGNSLNGGLNGGYINGGLNGGYMNGGLNGGYMNGGLNGGYMNGGLNGGYVNGGLNGGYINGGLNGGYVNGGFNGGYMNGGFNGGYINGGFNGGVNGGFNGGYINGGLNGGLNGGGFDYYSSQQSANYDRMMQMQGTSFQMGMSGGNSWVGGAGGAGYFPLNAGVSLYGSFGLGGGGGW